MTALTIVMQNFAEVLEEDAWCAYINMRCPDPVFHAMTAHCPECENRCMELEGIKNRVDVCRLSQTCKTFRSIAEDHIR